MLIYLFQRFKYNQMNSLQLKSHNVKLRMHKPTSFPNNLVKIGRYLNKSGNYLKNFVQIMKNIKACIKLIM